jgi:cytochrome c553
MKTTVKLPLILSFVITALLVVTCKHEIPLTDKDGNNNNDTCGAIVFTYSGAVAPLLTTYCTRCHNATTTRGGIDLSTYDGVKIVALNGRLLGSIKKETGYKPMPPGSTKLPDCQIRQIEKWVQAGSANN